MVTLALLEGFQSTIRNELGPERAHVRIAPRRAAVSAAGAVGLGSAGNATQCGRSASSRAPGSSRPLPMPFRHPWWAGLTRSWEVNRVLAAKLGVGVGAEVEVISPRHRLTPMGLLPVRTRLKVEQIRPTPTGSESGTVQLPLDVAQRLLWGEPAVEAVELRDPGDPWHLAGRVRRALGEDAAGLKVEGLDELNRPLLRRSRSSG